LSHNVASQTLNQTARASIGAAAGTAGIRNPAAVTQLLPGTSYQGNALIRVNALKETPRRSVSKARMPATDSSPASISRPSRASTRSRNIVQTSNFAAEYGQVGGGYFNLTMKSGTNQFHGSAYDYFVNEALNAGQPFTDNGRGGLIRPVQRRNDTASRSAARSGFPNSTTATTRRSSSSTSNSTAKTRTSNNQAITVPTPAYRLGDFREALTGPHPCRDPLGRRFSKAPFTIPPRSASRQTARPFATRSRSIRSFGPSRTRSL